MPMLCYQCIDYFLNEVDASGCIGRIHDWVHSIFKQRSFIFHGFTAFLKCFTLFYICSIHICNKPEKTQELVFEKNWTDSVVPTAKYKPEKSPRGGKSQLHICWYLLYCLWAILQLDQCIMSWHGPSLCADSSVTLGDPMKFISAVSPSQLSGPIPHPHPASSPFLKPEMVSVPSGHKGNRIHHKFLLQVSDTLQSEHVAQIKLSTHPTTHLED